jgi:hypothetical protein
MDIIEPKHIIGVRMVIITLVLKERYQLTLLSHVIVGTGLPDARHSKEAVAPFFTSTEPFRVVSDDAKSMRGGTATGKPLLTHRTFDFVLVNDNHVRERVGLNAEVMKARL